MEIADELNYLAGLFDGEGCICVVKHKSHRGKTPAYQLHCTVGMCNHYAPSLFHDTFGGHLSHYNHKLTQKAYWYWGIASQAALSFLRAISPYFRLKAQEAEIAIEFQEFKDKSHICRNRPQTPERLKVLEHFRTQLQEIKKGGSNYGT